MPIYEFYCADCHTLYNFFSRRVNTEKRPDCPRCGRPELVRRPSLFAVSRKGRERNTGEEEMPDIDESRLEQAFASMAGELENLDENNPRAMGRAMRRLFESAGLKLGPGMEEAFRRMEAGEDADQIESELGDILESEDPFADLGAAGVPNLKSLRNRVLPPRVDETLYDL